MEAYDVKQKIDQAIKAIEEYQSKINEGDTSIWDSDIKKGLDTLTEKRHMLGASGIICRACGGTGRI